jgi:hypothetical protein
LAGRGPAWQGEARRGKALQADYGLTSPSAAKSAAAKLKKTELAFKVNSWIENTARVDAHPNGPMAGVMGLFDRDFRNARGENRLNATSLERDVYRPAMLRESHNYDSRHVNLRILTFHWWLFAAIRYYASMTDFEANLLPRRREAIRCRSGPIPQAI